MKNVSIYVENANLTPSSYYRLTQYFQPSEAKMHSALPDYIYHWWHNLGSTGRMVFSVSLYCFYVFRTLAFLIEDFLTLRNGTVIFSRAIVPRRMPLLHKFLICRLATNNKIVWDFDDNIIANKRISPSDFHFFSKHSNTIIVTNDFLKSLIEPCFINKVILLPTTDGDMLSYNQLDAMSRRREIFDKEIRIVWVATDSGLDYIRAIIPYLDETARMVKVQFSKKLTLHVVCNKPLTSITSHLSIINICWEREIAKHEILNAHIGIMPLPDNTFTRGKGGFKLIQYMSASIPVIASNVGFNSQVVTKDTGFLVSEKGSDWEQAILALCADWNTYYSYATNARKHYDQSFSYVKNKSFWEELCTPKQSRFL